jgi:hypothetical protein
MPSSLQAVKGKGEVADMILRKWLGALVFAALALPVATAQAVNPFGRSGFELTNGDIAILTETTRPFFDDDTVPIGTAKSWNNPKSGNNGTATLIGRFEQKGMPCRRIQHDIKLKTVADPFRFIIDRCRIADGTWKML